MKKEWRSYITVCFIKIQPLMFSLRLHRFMHFLKVIKKTTKYKEYDLIMSHKFDNRDELNFELYYKAPDNNIKKHVLSCRLDGLWKDKSKIQNPVQVFDSHKEGDYFQSFINRQNKEYKLSPNVSFAAIFHEIMNENRHEFCFIKNIYSTSKLDSISNGNSFSESAESFWKKQVENNFASWVENEARYRAILD